MVLRTKSIASNINEPIVGRVTRHSINLEGNTFLMCEKELPGTLKGNFVGILTSQKYIPGSDLPVVLAIPSLDHLSEGDIVVANSDGNVNTLYRINSFHNTLLVTERCNSNCLMC